MKILHIVPNRFHTGWGYQENELVKESALDPKNEVEVIAGPFVIRDGVNRYEPNTIERKGRIAIVRLPFLFNRKGRFARTLRCIPGLIREVEKFQPDIIICHYIQFLSFIALKKYKVHNPNVKIVGINHADFMNSGTNFLSKNILHKIIWRTNSQKMVPFVDIFYGVTPGRVEFIRDVYKIPEGKIKYLPIGANECCINDSTCRHTRESIRKQIGADEDTLVIVSGGKFDKNKASIVALAEGVRTLSAYGKNVKLLIFGSVNKDTEKLLSLADGKSVFWMGWATDQLTYDYLSAGDVCSFTYLHSTLWEQAAGCGLPILLSSRFKNKTKFSDSSTVYVSDLTADGFAKCICESILPDSRKTALKKAAQTEAENFQYWRIWKEILADTGMTNNI